ncbi:MAG: hypothetical protein P3X22_001465 [Thermoprotei archaeon]|nr:hypothetical protein [Thermoprotei archaeon]
MSTSNSVKYRRHHIYLSPEDPLDAARFIANALLLSHGIRRDTAASAKVGGLWITVHGSEVKHLRPDEESLEGWIRAVLRGGGSKLGVRVSREPPRVGGAACFSVEGSDFLEGLASLSPPYVIAYGFGGFQCGALIRAPLNVKWSIIVVLVNIVLDNVEGAKG